MCRILLASMLILVLSGSAGFAAAESSVPATAPAGGPLHNVAEANNQFAFDLYARLKEQDKGNIFFSPYSISTALAMTYAGARSRTADQMAKVLHFEKCRDELPAGFKQLIEQQNEAGKKGNYQLSVANALWGQKGCGFLKEYLDLAERSYGAALNEVDFQNAAEPARQTINKWVEEKTREKIKDLLPPGAIDRLTRLVLTNAIYFKGNWALQFKEKDTRREPFTLLDGKKIDIPMMNRSEKFKYAADGDVQVLEMPYNGEELAMVIILPKKTDGIAEIEKALTAEKLAGWLDALTERNVVVALPKFKMTCAFSLAGVLRAMGMAEAFSGSADFSGMTGRPDFCISEVFHKAFVEVNEEGTEAAAATAVVMRATAMPRPDPVFRADHPFLFLIRDLRTGGILFVGRVIDPSAGG